MGLEIPTPKTPGDEIRRTEAPAPAFVGFLILALAVLIGLFGWLVLDAMYYIGDDGLPHRATLSAAGHDPAIPEVSFTIFGFKEVSFFTSEQTLVSFWLACIFFCLFAIILLYQRYFLDHITIAKRRFRKWEDEGVQLHG